MNDLVRAGIAALRTGDRVLARSILDQCVEVHPWDPDGWLWLSGAVDTDEERRQCLQQVLVLDPEHTVAKKGLLLLGSALVVEPTESSRDAQTTATACAATAPMIDEAREDPPRDDVAIHEPVGEVIPPPDRRVETPPQPTIAVIDVEVPHDRGMGPVVTVRQVSAIRPPHGVFLRRESISPAPSHAYRLPAQSLWLGVLLALVLSSLGTLAYLLG